jgi:hypothetical protein
MSVLIVHFLVKSNRKTQKLFQEFNREEIKVSTSILGRLPGLGIFVIYISGGVRTQHGVRIKVYNHNGFRRRINNVLFVPERDCVLILQIQCEFDAVAPTSF